MTASRDFPSLLRMAVVLVAALALSWRAQADEAAEAFVNDRAQRVLSIINDDALSSEARQDQLRDVISTTIDTELIARAAIKRYLNARRNPHYDDQEALDADFQAFVPVYEEYLLLTYESYLSVYRVADFQVLGSEDLDATRQRRYDSFSIVKTLVRGGEDDEEIEVAWDVIGRNGGLRIFDVEARGLSLLTEQETVMAEELADARGNIAALSDVYVAKADDLRPKALGEQRRVLGFDTNL